MPSILGAPLPRQRTGHVYLLVAIGFAIVSSIGAFRGKYGWGITEWALGFAAFFYLLPWLTPRRRENVQVDDAGVIVVTDKGRDEVRWSDVTRVRIITTSDGPWGRRCIFRARRRRRQGLHGSSRCCGPHEVAGGDADKARGY